MTEPSLRTQLFRRKPVAALVAESEQDSGLARRMGLVPLMCLGIGSTIGTGIFFVLSTAVPEAGPAVVVSFVLAAVTAALTALCYAELASSIPASGSSYSYAYATLGEVVAYGVGWCLVLEYGVSSSAARSAGASTSTSCCRTPSACRFRRPCPRRRAPAAG
ncbi:amino acid permease [Blastococcus sp. TF02A_35]|uniref:amino acid permease n=1 Tax=Blastococcus sp. TF02A-35 TaxID=2559612 RepID=UPI0024739688|nr:amino acid permease [Blastococcus sp. TF02A_35]